MPLFGQEGPDRQSRQAGSVSACIAHALTATLLVSGCGADTAAPPRTGPDQPTIAVASGAPPPATSQASACATAAAESATASASATAALATPAAVLLPPDEAALAARFREKDPIAHVRAFVIDESCFQIDQIPMAATRVQSSRISLFDASEDGLHLTAVDTRDASTESLADLRTFLAAFPETGRRFAVNQVSLAIGEQTSRFWRAYCMPQGALFGGPAEIGRIRNQDGTYDEDRYRVGFAPQAMEKLRGLPRQARRLAILHDDDLLVVLPIEKLKALGTPVVTLVKMAASAP